MTITLAAGAVLSGRLRVIALPGSAALTYDVGPGGVASAQLSYRLIDGGRSRPFVLLSLSASASRVGTTPRASGERDEPLTALDLRAGAVAGLTFFGRWSPFLVARVFGGPVFWTQLGRPLAGGSVDHYQLGVGSALALPGDVSLLAEWSMFGDRSLALAVGVGL